MITCPHCNHPNSLNADICSACQTPLPVLTYCPNCGGATPVIARFCGQCGFNLRGIPATATLVEAFPIAPNPLIPLLDEGNGGAGGMPTLNLAAPPSLKMLIAKGEAEVQTAATLLHLQTQTRVELPQGPSVIHLGKPNNRIPPNIDLSGFPDTEIVSRIHAALRWEDGGYSIEDVGSSNGTYVNSLLLSVGTRHRLRSGDRISLGKGDKVTLIFQCPV